MGCEIEIQAAGASRVVSDVSPAKAKEKTEKCLAKLDDMASETAKTESSRLQIERNADVGQPITNKHWGHKVVACLPARY